jgi:hypothetical protein
MGLFEMLLQFLRSEIHQSAMRNGVSLRVKGVEAMVTSLYKRGQIRGSARYVAGGIHAPITHPGWHAILARKLHV